MPVRPKSPLTPKPGLARILSHLEFLRPNIHLILVVDDEPDIRDSLKSLLELEFPGVQVLGAPDGPSGLAILKREEVDLVISDYRMPGMDGLEFLVRAREAKPDVPRILITAYPELDVAMRAINEVAISNFLTKPLNAGQLADVVRAALVKARARRA